MHLCNSNYLLMAGSRNNLIVRVGLDIYIESCAACCLAFCMCAIDIENGALKFAATLMVHFDYTIKYYYISASLFFFIQSIADAI